MRIFVVLLIVLLCRPCLAQQPYAIDTKAGDLNFPIVLNLSPAPASLGEARDRLVILDFFGTWCGPCIRALPHLQQLQDKFSKEIRILLVAEEPVQVLKNFIAKRSGFNLAMVIDTGSLLRKAIQPPFYPYTLVIAKNGRIMAHPTQSQLTEETIRGWIAAQDQPIAAAPNGSDTAGKISPVNTVKNPAAMSLPEQKTVNRLIQLSQDFLYAAKTGDSTAVFIRQLKEVSLEELDAALYTDDEKKAFWINMYNAYTQVRLKEDPDQYRKRGKFFSARVVAIAGFFFSLDDIEHGILRRSKIKWSLGYLNKFFPRKIEKRLRVSKLDYRLHFALNCGAKSCPPIAFYKPEEIDRQLNQASKAYISGEVTYDAQTNQLKLPAIMSWFRRDFGGKKEMINLVKKYGVLPEDKSPRISFKKYDWTIFLQNYKS